MDITAQTTIIDLSPAISASVATLAIAQQAASVGNVDHSFTALFDALATNSSIVNIALTDPLGQQGTQIPGAPSFAPYEAGNFTASTLQAGQIVGHPSHYLICDRTGFRVSVDEGLHKEWDGHYVRKQSWEPRHPQDFIRSKSEHEQKGSIREEQDDQYIESLYPSGVSTSDL